MKSQNKLLESKSGKFEFLITPIEIEFSRTEAQSYALQFCKGAQIYKKYGEVMWVHAEQKTCKIVNGEHVILKLQPDNSMQYEWSVYKVTDDEMKQFMTPVPIDLTLYHESFTAKKYQFMEKKAMKAVNLEEGITISFNLIIGCQLEKYLEEQNKRKADKKQKGKEKKGVHDGDVEGLLGGESILKDGSKRQGEQLGNWELQKCSRSRRGSHSNSKHNETLSDIIEASNECSSNMNHQQRSQKLNSVSQIPEEREQQSPMLFPSTKTQDFTKIGDFEDFDLKKSSTSREQSDMRPYGNGNVHRHILKKQKPFKNDEKFDMETAPQSSITQPSTLQNKAGAKTNKGKVSSFSMIVYALIVIVLGVSSLFLFEGKGKVSVGGINVGKTIQFVKSFVTNDDQESKRGVKGKKGKYADSKMKRKRNVESTEDSWLSSWTSNDEQQAESISNQKNETLHSQSKKKKTRPEPQDEKKEGKSSKSKQKDPSAKAKKQSVKRR